MRIRMTIVFRYLHRFGVHSTIRCYLPLIGELPFDGILLRWSGQLAVSGGSRYAVENPLTRHHIGLYLTKAPPLLYPVRRCER